MITKKECERLWDNAEDYSNLQKVCIMLYDAMEQIVKMDEHPQCTIASLPNSADLISKWKGE